MPDDPAVLAVLESNPRTPFELLRAIRILSDLGQPQLAQPFAQQLAGQQLDQTQKAVLFKQFPSATLMRLARNPELAKSVGPFIDDLFQSAAAFRRDPARLAEWAQQLSDSNESVRAQAAYDLLRAREAAVAPLVAILADPARAAQHRTAKRMLLHLGDVAVAPLLGVLESPDAALKTQVVEVLGSLAAGDAVPWLLGPLVAPETPLPLRTMTAAALERIAGQTPDSSTALRLLEHAARHRLEASRNQSGDGEPNVEVWHWDADQNQSVPVLFNKTGASLDEAVRLSAELYELDTQSPERRRLYLTALLQAAKLLGGLDKPLATGQGTPYAQAAEFGPHVVEDVLAAAMAGGYMPAATGAAQILGDIGSSELLKHGGATPSTLARAAHHADRRLRFAATEAIMKLHPTEPFAGSSYVTEALGYFAGSYGVPRILIAHPLSAEGGKLAGLAAALGYEADVATNGRQAYELAVESPDYELVLIHSAIARPAADELLAQLRRDRRTAMLPIGFIAPYDDQARVESFARRAGRAVAFLQPQNDAEMKLLVSDVLAHAGRSHVAAQERAAEALAAIEWLVELGDTNQRVFDISQLEPSIVPLLYVPQVAGKALELLAEIGTGEAQRASLSWPTLLRSRSPSAGARWPRWPAAFAATARYCVAMRSTRSTTYITSMPAATRKPTKCWVQCWTSSSIKAVPP